MDVVVKLERRQDWPERLADALRAMATRPFAWGEHDCALAACRVIEAVTGTDPAEAFRGVYDSQTGALRSIARVGPDGLEALVVAMASKLEAPEIVPLRARRGDLVLWDGPEGPTLGIVDLDGKHAVFTGQDGAVRQRVGACRRAWRVG